MGNAWVFPGQGSQKVGMAAAVLDLPGARERFDATSALLGRDLQAICAGELVALYAAGVFDAETGLQLIKTRS